jgi:hypothetical protein
MSLTLRRAPPDLARNPVARAVALAILRSVATDLAVRAYLAGDGTAQPAMLADARLVFRLAGELGAADLADAAAEIEAMQTAGNLWHSAAGARIDAALSVACERIRTASAADLAEASARARHALLSA